MGVSVQQTPQYERVFCASRPCAGSDAAGARPKGMGRTIWDKGRFYQGFWEIVAMKYVKIDTDVRYLFAELSDTEIGRLFDAILYYTDTGIEPKLRGNERFVWPSAKRLIAVHDTSNNHRGSRHWNWKGGITPQNQKERSSSRYKRWRDAVFVRDDYTCQNCGRRGGSLNAHHISPWANDKERRYDVSNGVTLCEQCHKKVHSRS